jgi:hypothetical protein
MEIVREKLEMAEGNFAEKERIVNQKIEYLSTRLESSYLILVKFRINIELINL